MAIAATLGPTASIPPAIRRILWLLETDDRASAADHIDTLLRAGDLPPSILRLLQGLAARTAGDAATELLAVNEALAIDARNAWALYCLAHIHAREGRIPQAVGSIMDAVAVNPKLGEAWFLLASLANEGRNMDVALHSLVTALECDVDNGLYWHRLNQWLPRVRVQGPMPAERALLTTALQRHAIEFQAVDQVIYAVLRDTASVRQLLEWSLAGQLQERLATGEAFDQLGDEFFLLVLRRATLQHADYEKLLTDLRRGLLRAISAGGIPATRRTAVLRFTSALAVYALGTEFVFHVAEDEPAALADCRRALLGRPTADPDWPLWLAALACYELLADTVSPALAGELAGAAHAVPEFDEMIRVHLVEPMMAEAQLAAVVPLGEIRDGISLRVQQQYEEHPYPRWRFLGQLDPATFDSRIARALPHLGPAELPRLQARAADPLAILIAGCGTGRHALWCGRQYHNARILAVDLSRASLAYAAMKAGELSIHNIEFRHGDLLDLPALGRQFDVIESVGVLHHMRDPAAGLAALVRCLRAGGWMKLALYSHSARAAVRQARALIADRGYPATSEGIRSFRHDIMSNADDPLHESCARWRDFFSLSECRDLVFHVQEHQFTTAGLAQLIGDAGLEFMGFDGVEPVAAGAGPRLTDPRSLSQWGEVEAANPDLFGNMYVMWLRKPA